MLHLAVVILYSFHFVGFAAVGGVEACSGLCSGPMCQTFTSLA